jgi:hypothetical protein
LAHEQIKRRLIEGHSTWAKRCGCLIQWFVLYVVAPKSAQEQVAQYAIFDHRSSISNASARLAHHWDPGKKRRRDFSARLYFGPVSQRAVLNCFEEN